MRPAMRRPMRRPTRLFFTAWASPSTRAARYRIRRIAEIDATLSALHIDVWLTSLWVRAGRRCGGMGPHHCGDADVNMVSSAATMRRRLDEVLNMSRRISIMIDLTGVSAW